MEDLELVFEKYYKYVKSYAVSLCFDESLAEDITQDVFVKFMQCDKEFSGDEHIKAWLLRVTINRCKSFFTSSWQKKTEGLSDDIVFNTEEKSDVYYATLELPKKYRVVIHLFYYEDMSVADIAKYLGIKETTVKTQLHRGRELLKIKLKGEYDFV